MLKTAKGSILTNVNLWIREGGQYRSFRIFDIVYGVRDGGIGRGAVIQNVTAWMPDGGIEHGTACEKRWIVGGMRDGYLSEPGIGKTGDVQKV